MSLSVKWFRGPLALLAAALVLVGLRAGAADDAVEARLRKDITYLASDECEGRGVETQGINRAAEFIAAEFRKAGLKPGGTEGTYYQPFTMNGMARLESPNTLQLRGPLGQEIDLKLDSNFRPLGLSGAGKVSAPVVFVGYGIHAPRIGYDDFKGVNVEGKVVVVLRKTPRFDSPHAPFDGDKMAEHAGLATKVVNADLAKAAAVLFVNDLSTVRQERDRLMEFRDTALGTRSARMPVLHIQRHIADALVEGALATDLRTIEEDIARDLKPRSAALTGWTATLETNVRRPVLSVKNVVGIVEVQGVS